jgi:acyl-CoA synthetase (AMP-forming)/AMP-acid ligase II
VIYQATLRRELHHQDLRRSLLQPPRQLRPQHTRGLRNQHHRNRQRHGVTSPTEARTFARPFSTGFRTPPTTGTPKGVLYSHRSTLLHAYAICLPDVFNLSSRETVLPVVPMFHVNAWGLPYGAPLAGSKLVLPGPGLDGASLYELFEREQVTFSAGVPTVWMGLLEYLRTNGLTLSSQPRLVVGGAAAPPAMMKAFSEEFGVTALHAWGMTEMSPVGTLCSLKGKHLTLGQHEKDMLRAKQGRPLFGVELEIVDEEGKPLPHDGKAFGDLLVRGPWTCASYFKGEGGDILRPGGWFATGDVATLDTDGYMQITDRSKDVIKSGGEWISSIELENLAAGPSRRRRGSGDRPATSEMGRASPAGGGEEERCRAVTRRSNGFHARQGRQLVAAG